MQAVRTSAALQRSAGQPARRGGGRHPALCRRASAGGSPAIRSDLLFGGLSALRDHLRRILTSSCTAGAAAAPASEPQPTQQKEPPDGPLHAFARQYLLRQQRGQSGSENVSPGEMLPVIADTLASKHSAFTGMLLQAVHVPGSAGMSFKSSIRTCEAQECESGVESEERGTHSMLWQCLPQCKQGSALLWLAEGQSIACRMQLKATAMETKADCSSDLGKEG